MRVYFSLFFLLMCVSGLSQASGPTWAYKGADRPEYWYTLSKSFTTCKMGDDQSPIDFPIVKNNFSPKLSFDYLQSKLNIINNGHTIEALYDEGSFITFAGSRYQVKQFHFHVHSEHAIQKKHADMEMHIVHQSPAGHYAVVAVLFNITDKDNVDLQPIWNNLPTLHSTKRDGAIRVYLEKLLPKSKAAYYYSGSLTTPPCSQNISWFVLKNPLTLSKSQLQIFLHLIGPNARPTRPLNGRPLYNINN